MPWFLKNLCPTAWVFRHQRLTRPTCPLSFRDFCSCFCFLIIYLLPPFVFLHCSLLFLLWSSFYFKNSSKDQSFNLFAGLGIYFSFLHHSLSLSLSSIFDYSLCLSLFLSWVLIWSKAFWFGLLWLKGMLCSRKMFSFLVRKDIKKVLKRKDSDAGHKGN